jgi:hypothetical protein
MPLTSSSHGMAVLQPFARNQEPNFEDICTNKCHVPLFDHDSPVHATDK